MKLQMTATPNHVLRGTAPRVTLAVAGHAAAARSDRAAVKALERLGFVTVLATFTDKTTAVVVVTVP